MKDKTRRVHARSLRYNILTRKKMDTDSTDPLGSIMLPSDQPSHNALGLKDTLNLPDSDKVTRTRSLKVKRNSNASESGTRPASIAVFGSPQSSRRVSKTGSSTSLNSDCMDAAITNHEEILQLTRDVRVFSDSLNRLKLIYNPEAERTESLRFLAHDKLRDLLNTLRSILDKYNALRSTDIYTASVLLITQIKSLKDESEEERIKLFEAIDQLALAFSSSVTEYLMGDVEQSSFNMGFPSSKSYDSLSSVTTTSESCNVYSRQSSLQDGSREIANELDDTLMRLDTGLDLALDRAKVWSKYAKDIIIYVEKRIHLESEFSRSLAKLAGTTRTILKEETYLPFQSTYLTALEHDVNYAENCETTYSHIQGHKFVEQLEQRRNAHDKKRKHIREMWKNTKKEMQDRKSNLDKYRQQYFSRCQDYEKMHESAAKMECEALNTSGGSTAGKLEKKRKAEDDALLKMKESETIYKSCVVEANAKRKEMAAVKRELLVKLRELIYQCDQTMKAVTVSYFQLQHSLSAPAPVQFQTLCEQSRSYEPGVQLNEFVRHYKPRVKGRSARHDEPFVFEAYESFDRTRKPSSQSTDSLEEERSGSPARSSLVARSSNSLDRADKSKPMHAWAGPPSSAHASDSDSISGSSTKSVDVSPSASPLNGHRNLNREASTGTLSSGDELAETDSNVKTTIGTRHIEPVPSSFRNITFSKAAHTHLVRKLRTPSKCRECDCYVYFNGAECERCGLACHKKCLETLAIQCGGKRLLGRMNVFGVQLRDHLKATNRDAPFLVTKCCAEIEKTALHLKGIYRVAGFKVKVEKLCQTFENGLDLVDLSETPPHLISSVLKLYLRQLPEPLLTFKHYPDFVNIAKEFPRSVPDSAEEEERLISRLRGIVMAMPEENFKTLRVLMHHLKSISENEDYNQMTASNLGIVFGPTLLRPNDNTASLSALVDMPHQTRAVEMLILYAQVFGHRETPVDPLRHGPRETMSSSPSPTAEATQGTPSYSSNKSTNNSTHIMPVAMDTPPLPGYVLPGSSHDNDEYAGVAGDVGSGEEGDGDSSGDEADEVSASEDQPDSDQQDISPVPPRRHSRRSKRPQESAPQPIKQTLLAVASGYHKTQSPSSLPEASSLDAAPHHQTPPPDSSSPIGAGYVPSAYAAQSQQQQQPQSSLLMTDGAEVTIAGVTVDESSTESTTMSPERSSKTRQPQFV